MDIVEQLRQRFAGSGEQPRPIAEIDMPAKFRALMTPELMASLKPAAVLLAVLLYGGDPRLLLTRRSESLRSHQGQISFPGGRRDAGDPSFAAAALREADEEVGLAPAAVEVIGYLDDYPTLTGFRITPVLGLVAQPFTATPHVDEVAEVIEVPLADVLYSDRFERRIMSSDGIEFPTYELYHGPHRVWGATAAILWELRQRVREAA